VNSPALPRERWARMERRLRHALLGVGLEDVETNRVMASFDRAMRHRRQGLPDEDDFRYLHPGRVVLILLSDLEERDPGALEAGALAESRDVALRAEGAPPLPQPDWWGASDGGVAASGTGGDEAPTPEGGGPAAAPGVLSDEELLEALVTASPRIQRLALAEALDQLRHAHLWSEARHRARAAALARGVFLPLAGRAHPILERRLGWWVRKVGPHLAAP